MLQTINTSLAFLDTLDLINFCLKMCICSYLFVHVTDAMDKDKKGVGGKPAIIKTQTSDSTIQPRPSLWQDKTGHSTVHSSEKPHILNLGLSHRDGFLACDTGISSSQKGFCQECQLMYHMFSVPTEVPKTALSLPSLTGTTQCSLGSCCARPQTGAHLMHGYPVEQPTIFPTSSSGKFSNFPSPPSQKGFSPGKRGYQSAQTAQW